MSNSAKYREDDLVLDPKTGKVMGLKPGAVPVA